MMNKRIINYNEKKVIVARQVMILNLDSTPENVITEWEKMYPKDIDRVRDNTELFDWMAKFIRNNNVKFCNALLARVRNKQEKILRTKCKYIGYGAKLVDCPKNELAKYIIFTRGKKYSGNYNSMCCMIGRIREDLRLKEKEQ